MKISYGILMFAILAVAFTVPSHAFGQVFDNGIGFVGGFNGGCGTCTVPVVVPRPPVVVPRPPIVIPQPPLVVPRPPLVFQRPVCNPCFNPCNTCNTCGGVGIVRPFDRFDRDDFIR